MAYNPRLPPRNKRPSLPAFKAPAARASSPTIYRWGQSNPALAAGSRKVSAKPAVYAPPAGSASTPVSPSGAVMPVDPAYDLQIGALQRQRDTSVSGLQSQRAASLLNYGYNEGAGGALTFDPSNAFSTAAQLKKRFDQDRSATGISMANRGQLYAGSYQTLQDQLNQGQLQGEDSLQKRVLAYLAQNTGQQAQAGTDYLSGEAQAGSDRLGRLASNPLYTPGTADAAAAAGPASTSAVGSGVKPIPAKYRGRLGIGSRLKPAAVKRSPAPAPVPAGRRPPSRRVR